jgi:hypothetical protein
MSTIRIDGAPTRWDFARKAQWVARCERLELEVAAATLPELHLKIRLALSEYFQLRLRMGDLPDILRENAWRADPPLPDDIPMDEPNFDVPFALGDTESAR